MKKVLIFYACYGGGHLSAAKSIKQYFDKNHKDVEAKMVDCVEYVNKSLNKITTAAYREMAKKAPWAWEKVYYKSQEGILSKVSTTTNKIMAVKMAKLFREFNPDVVISTHPFGSQMTSYLKRKNKTSCKLATIMTDYAPHDQWLVGEEFCDFFFVSNSAMKEDIVKRGISASKIFVSGIPISNRFLQEHNKEEIYHSFNLSNDKKTILFFGGGEYGLGKDKTINLFKYFMTIPSNFQVIAIAGKNESMKNSFESIVRENNKEDSVKVLPFTDKVPELMAISDLVITKPGGLTVTESLACSLPLIVINPIPGQEEENAEFLENSGVALWIRKDSNYKKIFDSILLNPDKLIEMKNNATILARRNSTADICETVLK